MADWRARPPEEVAEEMRDQAYDGCVCWNGYSSFDDAKCVAIIRDRDRETARAIAHYIEERCPECAADILAQIGEDVDNA